MSKKNLEIFRPPLEASHGFPTAVRIFNERERSLGSINDPATYISWSRFDILTAHTPRSFSLRYRRFTLGITM